MGDVAGKITMSEFVWGDSVGQNFGRHCGGKWQHEHCRGATVQGEIVKVVMGG